MNIKQAREIATDAIYSLNATGWDGKGIPPTEFKTSTKTFPLPSDCTKELDINFDCIEGMWLHCCKLRDKESNKILVPMHGSFINSIEAITETIMTVCSKS